jgi:hypothetical protein
LATLENVSIDIAVNFCRARRARARASALTRNSHSCHHALPYLARTT